MYFLISSISIIPNLGKYMLDVIYSTNPQNHDCLIIKNMS